MKSEKALDYDHLKAFLEVAHHLQQQIVVNRKRRFPVGFVFDFRYLRFRKNEIVLVKDDSFFTIPSEMRHQKIGQSTFP
jgi:hypothetical protein